MAAIINVEWQNNFADAVPGRLKKKRLSCPDSIENLFTKKSVIKQWHVLYVKAAMTWQAGGE